MRHIRHMILGPRAANQSDGVRSVAATAGCIATVGRLWGKTDAKLCLAYLEGDAAGRRRGLRCEGRRPDPLVCSESAMGGIS